VRIGTTGKGIGPAYEDKVARRALRVYDLFYPARFAEKLKENLDYHNFVLTRYLGAEAVDFDAVLAQAMADAEEIKPLVTDVSAALHAINRPATTCCSKARRARCSTSITAPTLCHLVELRRRSGGRRFRHRSGHAALRAGNHQGLLHARWRRAFPERAGYRDGRVCRAIRCRRKGREFGTVTGRKRRCGWLDAAALKRSIQINGVTGLCITKLDVLDGLAELKICTAYQLDGKTSTCCRWAPTRSPPASRCSRTCRAGPSLRSASVRWRPCRQRRVPIWRVSKTVRGSGRHRVDRTGARERRWSVVIHWGDRGSRPRHGSPRRAGRE
jgi:adenylosuccinate synthase